MNNTEKRIAEIARAVETCGTSGMVIADAEWLIAELRASQAAAESNESGWSERYSQSERANHAIREERDAAQAELRACQAELEAEKQAHVKTAKQLVDMKAYADAGEIASNMAEVTIQGLYEQRLIEVKEERDAALAECTKQISVREYATDSYRAAKAQLVEAVELLRVSTSTKTIELSEGVAHMDRVAAFLAKVKP